jgi:ribosomal-protein-serine acetyltransferase
VKKMDAFPLVLDQRTALVPIEAADAVALHGLVEANRAWLIPWMPWARDATPATTEAFVAEALAAARDETGFHFTLRRASERVGALGFHQIDRRNRCAQLGYWLGAAACGHGLATRAAAALMAWAFDGLALERIELRIHPDNVRSRAVAERLGCLHAGSGCEPRLPGNLRDFDQFVMTARRWRTEPA